MIKAHIKTRILFVLLMFTAGSAQAAIVNFSLTGEVSIAQASNPFGLTAPGTVTATGVFDDSVISSTGETYIDFAVAGNNMDITIGNTIFTDSMDLYGGGIMYFVNGAFSALNYRSIGVASSLSSSGYTDLIFNGGVLVTGTTTGEIVNGTYIEGTWTSSSFTTTVVPVPAAAWLFLSGLAFLAGIARKKG